MKLLKQETFEDSDCFDEVFIYQKAKESDESGIHMIIWLGTEDWIADILDEVFVSLTSAEDLRDAMAISENDQKSLERLRVYVEQLKMEKHTPNVLKMQTNLMQEAFETHLKRDYICVAFKRKLPVYWMFCDVNGSRDSLHVNFFIRSLFSDLARVVLQGPVIPRCGAPFFSYIIDKFMHGILTDPVEPLRFFIDAREGTRKILATIEGNSDEPPVHLHDILKSPKRFHNVPMQWNFDQVYYPTDDFMNAWKSVSKKRLKCIGCYLNPARYRVENDATRIYCSRHCFEEEEEN